MSDEPEIERNSWSIVLIGSFNPAIFHPAWLALNGVISKEVGEAGQVNVVHPEVSSISIDTIRIEVQRNRYISKQNNLQRLPSSTTYQKSLETSSAQSD